MNLSLKARGFSLLVIILIASNCSGTKNTHILLGKNSIYNNLRFHSYYHIGARMDSLISNKYNLEFCINFNNFKSDPNFKRNYIEGVNLVCSKRSKFNPFVFYYGPLLTYRHVNFNYINSSAQYNERTIGVGLNFSIGYEFSKRFAFHTEANTFVANIRFIHKNTSTGYNNSRDEWFLKYNKLISLTLTYKL